ncbi:VCAN [Branchiostoma lanceolatum]|uniref:VCAN protein n=1 Tax=Branchiostoma lanceolatum TaxID=7740 RepID=A0A8J9W857_BRALA|nr:VCAN [Branchiostoma lanceolatum]
MEIWTNFKSRKVHWLALGCGLVVIAAVVSAAVLSTYLVSESKAHDSDIQGDMMVGEKLKKPTTPWYTEFYMENISTVVNSTSFTSPSMLASTESLAATMTSGDDDTSPVTLTSLPTTENNECVRKPCQYGSCENKDGGYKCTCSPGWTGQNCQQDINECTRKACQHGRCENQNGGYKCTCSPGWTGQNCQQAGACQSGWTESNNHCYKLMTDAADWTTANTLCNTTGANLAYIKDQRENNFIESLIPNGTKRIKNIWIGLRVDIQNQHLKWTDGSEATYTHLAPKDTIADAVNAFVGAMRGTLGHLCIGVYPEPLSMGNLNRALVLLCVVSLWCSKEAVGTTPHEAAEINSLIAEAVAKVQQLKTRVVDNQDLLVLITQSAPRWKPVDGAMKYVTVGSSGIWGVDQADSIYYRSGTFENEASTGNNWVNIPFGPGGLSQIASGRSVWGVNRSQNIFVRLGITPSNPTGTSWHQIGGGLSQLDVSSTAFSLWGVNSGGYIYRRTGITADNPGGAGWQWISGGLKFVSTGAAGVWGANRNNDVFYRVGTHGNEASAGTGWAHIAGKRLKQVSSGDNIVWGVDTSNDVFIREGIGASSPSGTGWRQVPVKLKQVEASPRFELAWGVNSTDNVLQRIAGVPLP